MKPIVDFLETDLNFWTIEIVLFPIIRKREETQITVRKNVINKPIEIERIIGKYYETCHAIL